jgi:hypothetical protein
VNTKVNHHGEKVVDICGGIRNKQILGQELVRQVTVHAAGDRVVRAAAPRHVLLVHDVAVLARERVG